MHDDQIHIDAALVEGLIARQFPEWAGLTVRRMASDGTDNAMFRLGDALVVRLPRIPSAVVQLRNEIGLLPHLTDLQLETPSLVAEGAPDAGLPYSWCVLRWIEGESAVSAELSDHQAEAVRLGAFVRALHRLDPSHAPLAGAQNQYRGVPLRARDEATRKAASGVSDLYDAHALLTIWEAALGAPEWDAAPVVVHGDIHAANMLLRGGRLAAVIDFGLAGAGDPAVDMIPAWSFFDGAAREAFRESAGVDEATWARGRGWALSTALVALAYYRGGRNAYLEAMSNRVIRAVLEDVDVR